MDRDKIVWHIPLALSNSYIDDSKGKCWGFLLIRAILQFLLIILIAQISWKFIEKPIRQGALRNIQFKNLRIQNVTLGVKLALICTLFVSSIAVVGLSKASKAKENSQQDKVETAQTQPAPHPVAVWENPNQETPQNKGNQKK